MKKIIAIISVLTMLVAFMATPVSAATYDTSLDYAFGSGTGVKVVGVPTASKTPVVDGKIEANEYAGSYNNTAYLPMTNSSHQKLAENFNASVAAADAKASIAAGLLNMETLVKDSKLTYSFAQDDKNIYIAVKFDAGVEYNMEGNTIKMETVTPPEGAPVTIKSVKNVLSRYALNYRFGFNVGDVDEYIELQTNMCWGDLMTSDKAKVLFGFAGAAGQDIKGDGVVTAWYRSVIANETGFQTNAFAADKLAVQGEEVNHQNPATDYTVYDEICISKEALFKSLTDYSTATLETLPNAFYFAASINGQLCGTKADGTRAWLSSGGGGFYMFTGTKHTYENSTNEVFPDLIVFADKTTVAKADVKTGEPATATTAPATTAPTTTAPTTTAPTTTAPAGDVTTAAPAVTTAAPEAEGGCGGTVTVAGLALVAALGTCAVFVEKKRK